MNVYRLAIINGKVVDTTDLKQVMVHGAGNYEKAIIMFKNGATIDEVRKKFCGNCGGELPCGCSNPCPQGE